MKGGWHIISDNRYHKHYNNIKLDSDETNFIRSLKKAKNIMLTFHGNASNRGRYHRIMEYKVIYFEE